MLLYVTARYAPRILKSLLGNLRISGPKRDPIWTRANRVSWPMGDPMRGRSIAHRAPRSPQQPPVFIPASRVAGDPKGTQRLSRIQQTAYVRIPTKSLEAAVREGLGHQGSLGSCKAHRFLRDAMSVAAHQRALAFSLGSGRSGFYATYRRVITQPRPQQTSAHREIGHRKFDNPEGVRRPSRWPSEVTLHVGGRMLSPIENKSRRRKCAWTILTTGTTQ